MAGLLRHIITVGNSRDATPDAEFTGTRQHGAHTHRKAHPPTTSPSSCSRPYTRSLPYRPRSCACVSAHSRSPPSPPPPPYTRTHSPSNCCCRADLASAALAVSSGEKSFISRSIVARDACAFCLAVVFVSCRARIVYVVHRPANGSRQPSDHHPARSSALVFFLCMCVFPCAWALCLHGGICQRLSETRQCAVQKPHQINRCELKVCVFLLVVSCECCER